MMARRLLAAAWAAGLLAAATLLAAEAEPEADEKPKDWPKGRLEWKALFNNTDLEGWTVEGKGQWTVEGGCIVGKQDPITHSESWLLSEEEFDDFVLLAKFQITAGGNSGLFFRAPKVRGHPAQKGFEMQIWDADKRNPTGSIYGAATAPAGLQREGWNEVMVCCVGHSLFAAINGRVAAAVTPEKARSLAGRIGFQVHGGIRYKDTVVRFRDVWLAPVAAPEDAPGGVRFTKVKLDGGINEGAAVFDVDRDRRLDIVCGPFWYQNPTWKGHPVRHVKTNAYAESFYELPCDVNLDGWLDLVAGGAFAKTEYWYANPRRPGKVWPASEWMEREEFIEDMVILDLDGNQRANDLLPNGNGDIQWIQILAGRQPTFRVHAIGSKGKGHGIGYGDVNADGRIDILTPEGWYEAPDDRAKGQWTWRPEFKLQGAPGIPIRTLDLSGDHTPDIVYGNGHGYGLWWLEQVPETETKSAWREHLIDDSFAQAHYIELGDINDDGRIDIVAGKRWLAHNGHDEGGREPTCLFWFEHDGKGEGWKRHTIDYNGGAGCGMGLQLADIDRDGDLDIVAPGKGGLYLFLNLGR